MSVEEIDTPEFEKYLDSEMVFVKARGDISGVLRIYSYSYMSSIECIFMTELNLNFQNQEFGYTIKCANKAAIPKYEEFLMKVIDPIL